MPVFPIQWGGITASAGEVTGTSTSTQLTAGGSNNTKASSYTQLIASTPFVANWLIIEAATNTNGSVMLIDIAIGPSSSEVDVVQNLMVQGPKDLLCIPLPIQIPAGVRLSARAQAGTASQVCFLKVTLIAAQVGMQPSGGVVDCYGANTGTSRGVSIDPGGSANTLGGWTQIVASTNRRARGFVLLIGGQGNTNTLAGDWLYDVGIGAGGAEQVVLQYWHVNVRAAGNVHPQPHCSPFIPIPIGAGTRIAVRSQSTVIDATDRLHDVQIVCVG